MHKDNDREKGVMRGKIRVLMRGDKKISCMSVYFSFQLLSID